MCSSIGAETVSVSTRMLPCLTLSVAAFHYGRLLSFYALWSISVCKYLRCRWIWNPVWQHWESVITVRSVGWRTTFHKNMWDLIVSVAEKYVSNRSSNRSKSVCGKIILLQHQFVCRWYLPIFVSMFRALTLNTFRRTMITIDDFKMIWARPVVGSVWMQQTLVTYWNGIACVDRPKMPVIRRKSCLI